MFLDEKGEILEELPAARAWTIQSPCGVECFAGGFDSPIDVR